MFRRLRYYNSTASIVTPLAHSWNNCRQATELSLRSWRVPHQQRDAEKKNTTLKMNVESVERERERRLTNWLCSARWKKVFDTDLLPSNAPGTTYCALTHSLCHCFTQLNMSGLEFLWPQEHRSKLAEKSLFWIRDAHSWVGQSGKNMMTTQDVVCSAMVTLLSNITIFYLRFVSKQDFRWTFFFCSWQNFAIHLLQLVIFFRIAKGLRSDWVMLEPTLDSWSHHLRSARTQYLRLVMRVQLTQFSICMF